MAKKEKIPGDQAFNAYFSEIYGSRWPGLLEALGREPQSQSLSSQLLKDYFLDPASLVPPGILEIQPGHRVLDLCAAPGGKTLALALALRGQGSLTANDRSATRRARLHRVLEEHLPENFRSIVRVTGHDAALWGQKESQVYDRILLDAPCSSERHLVHSPEHLAQWTPSRTKSLAIQSFAMLASALEALKIGGILVYSTCSLSPWENEENLEKLAKKRSGQWEELPGNSEAGEKRKWGRLILPDHQAGQGPIYYAKIRKLG